MSDQFVGEIRAFATNFAPVGWAACSGQLMPLSQNTALFSLLGTYYGGDGKSTFGLPNLNGSVPIAQGDGPGLTSRQLGESGGSTTVTLLESEMPAHSHPVGGSASDGGARGPSGALFANEVGGIQSYAAPGPAAPMGWQAVSPTGASQPHNNMAPYLTLTYCIALQGTFPPRS